MLEYVRTKFLTDKILHTKTLPYLSGINNFVNGIYLTAKISTSMSSQHKSSQTYYKFIKKFNIYERFCSNAISFLAHLTCGL